MEFSVTVQPQGQRFVMRRGETLLDAALRQGLDLPHGCRRGTCGMCKVKMVNGRIEMGPHSMQALAADEAAQGHALMCCASACTDLVIERVRGDQQAATLPARVIGIERLAPDVIRLRLQLPGATRLAYRAGQFLQVILRDGARRCYSMAAAPGQDEQIELHVRHLPGGLFSDLLFGVSARPLKVRDVLRVSAPHGHFHLRQDSDKPIVLLASGTGFAPIKAIVEHARIAGIERPMTLYWGGRRPHDLYMNALAQAWARELPGFSYVPVVSDASPQDAWHGRRGFVHRAVIEDHADLSSHQVYACGAPVMVDTARRDFTLECGLPEHEFHADVFASGAGITAKEKAASLTLEC